MKKFLVTFFFICCSVFLCQLPNAIADNPPVIISGPFLAYGPWPVLPTDPDNPMILAENYNVLWTFSDDFASCSDVCTHIAQYKKDGGNWQNLTVTSDPVNGHASIELPVTALQNNTRYAFRFSVTDCAGQKTESPLYYFKAWYEKPPVIGDGPFLACGSWPVLSTNSGTPTFIDTDCNKVLWTFSDDFGTCSGPCTHSAQYKKLGGNWQNLTVIADPSKGQASIEFPIAAMQDGKTYVFQFSVTDCAGQETESGQYFIMPREDKPPVIIDGPFVAGGYWPKLPEDPALPFWLNQNCTLLWTFSDDFATCTGDCTHRAQYKKDGGNWQNLTVTADPAQGHATTDLPITSLIRNKLYHFRFFVEDCAGQETPSPVYNFGFGTDADRDGVADEEDNCLSTYNPNQKDADNDDIGDCCDPSPGCGIGCGVFPCDTVCTR